MHPDTERFMQFLYAATKVTANATLGERAGISKSKFHQQRNNPKPVPAETVIAICVAWDIDVLTGLERAGYITPEVQALASERRSLRALPETMLLEELLDRANDRAGTPPVDELARKRAERNAARGDDEPFTAPDDLDDDLGYNDSEAEPSAASEKGRHSMDNVDQDAP